jgi:hypothetical protein
MQMLDNVNNMVVKKGERVTNVYSFPTCVHMEQQTRLCFVSPQILHAEQSIHLPGCVYLFLQ